VNLGEMSVTLEMVQNPRIRAWLATYEPGVLKRAMEALGYHLISKKDNCVARVHVPRFADAVRFADDLPDWLKDDMRRHYERGAAGEWARLYGDVLTLTEEELAAFIGKGKTK